MLHSAIKTLGNNAFREYVRTVLMTTEYEHNRRKECRTLISNLVDDWMVQGGKFVQRVGGRFVLAPRMSCLRLAKHLANRYHRNMKKEVCVDRKVYQFCHVCIVCIYCAVLTKCV